MASTESSVGEQIAPQAEELYLSHLAALESDQPVELEALCETYPEHEASFRRRR